MKKQGEECSQVARRSRRLRLILPSLFVGSVISACPVIAQITMQIPQQAVDTPKVAPVLKSVGIKFRASDSSLQGTTTTIVESVRTTAPANISPPTIFKPDILMPPLVAGFKGDSGNNGTPKTDSVKMELHSDSSPKAETRHTLLVEGTPTEASAANREKMAAPAVLEAPSQKAKPAAPIAMQLPLEAPLSSPAETKIQVSLDVPRTPQVVKIPSMTISNSVVIKTPQPASEAILPTPLPVPNLALNKLASPPKALPVVPSAPAAVEQPLLLNQQKIQFSLTDKPSMAPESSGFATAPVQSKPNAKPAEAVAETAPPRHVEARNDLPTVVALPVSRVSSVPASSESRQKELARSSAMTRQTGSSSSNQLHSTSGNLKTIEVLHRNSQTIEIGRPIARIDIQDESVCKALATEGTSIILMGLSKGQTTFTVWTAAGREEPATPESYRVNVCDAWAMESVENRTLQSIEKVQESLSELFPTAEIRLKSNSNGGLIIYGTAQSNEQARKISQLVRKAFLVPVIDRVAVVSP